MNSNTTIVTSLTKSDGQSSRSDATLESRSHAADNEAFAQEINQVIQPPKSVCAANIEVRALLLVSDQTNQYGGRFDADGLATVARLVIDSPILVGHRKDRLPIGRVFRAELVTIDDERWVKVWFYWLRDTGGSETLVNNIDGGVYKECSLGFTFAKPICSVCGEDSRTCGHLTVLPGAPEDGGPHFIYHDIQKVLEVSLVYRGATTGTRVGVSTLSADLDGAEKPKFRGLKVHRIRLLPEACDLSDCCWKRIGEFPLLEGLPLFVVKRDGRVQLALDDMSLAPKRLHSFLKTQLAEIAPRLPDGTVVYGRLMGMRGKERRSLSELIKRIDSHTGPVRSVRFRALELINEEGEVVPSELDALCQSVRWLQRQPELLTGSATGQSTETLYFAAPGEFVICRGPQERIFTAKSGSDSLPIVKSAHCGETTITTRGFAKTKGVALLFAQSVSETDRVTVRGCKTLVQPTELLTMEETVFPRPEESAVLKIPSIRFTEAQAQFVSCEMDSLKSRQRQFVIEDSAGARRFARVIRLSHSGKRATVALVTTANYLAGESR